MHFNSTICLFQPAKYAKGRLSYDNNSLKHSYPELPILKRLLKIYINLIGGDRKNKKNQFSFKILSKYYYLYSSFLHSHTVDDIVERVLRLQDFSIWIIWICCCVQINANALQIRIFVLIEQDVLVSCKA